MTIDDYVKEQKQTLDNFLTYFKEANVTEPELYPLELHSAGEWDEQFVCFSECQDIVMELD